MVFFDYMLISNLFLLRLSQIMGRVNELLLTTGSGNTEKILYLRLLLLVSKQL